MTAIQADAANNDDTSDDITELEAGEQFLQRFLPKDDASKKKLSGEKAEDDKSAPPKSDDEDDNSAEKPEPKSDDEEDGEDKEHKDGDEDDSEEVEAEAVVKIKVGDEELEVPVSKLARLHGQEAALTKKSMEVAEQRKTYETKLTEQAATTQALLARAKQRYEPYAKLDFNLLAAQIPAGKLTNEEYTSLREAATAAYEDVQFLEQHTSAFMQQVQANRASTVREAAVEAIKVLSGPPDKGGIEGWGEQTYNDIRAHAVAQGAPADVINQITDPWAIRMMHSALLFDRGRTKGAIKTVKVNKGPKKITKTTTSPSSKPDGGKKDDTKAMARLKSNGSVDDAADVFLARAKSADGD